MRLIELLTDILYYPYYWRDSDDERSKNYKNFTLE